MDKHSLWMIVGCVLPVLILFLLPALGFNNGVSITGFLILMLGCHLMHFAVCRKNGELRGKFKK